jgi:hypothetical protein
MKSAQELKYSKASPIDNRSLLTSNRQTTDPENHAPGKRAKVNRFSIPWKFELLAWGASCCFFIAIFVVLRTLDGRPAPDMRYGITPNAIIGLLSTFAEFLLILPVQSALGQLKWLQAVRTRPLDEFRVIDDASRGPWGGVMLLVRRKGGYVLLYHIFEIWHYISSSLWLQLHY